MNVVNAIEATKKAQIIALLIEVKAEMPNFRNYHFI